MAFRKDMLSLCSPLWWESQRRLIVHSGSMCVVRTPKASFGITNHHVLEQYEKDKETFPDVFCQLGSGPFDPLENVISRSWYWDLATFRLPTLTLQHFGHKILDHPTWPPPLLQQSDPIAYGGYPEDRRTVGPGEKPKTMTADLISFRGTPHGCGERNVSMKIDRENLTWLPGVTEPLAIDATFSGMSGGPCFRIVATEGRIELAAVIYEGHMDYGIFLARPTTLISDEGSIAPTPLGERRRELERLAADSGSGG